MEPRPWWVEDRAEQFRVFARTDGRTAPLYARIAGAAADDPDVLGLLDPAPEAQQRTVLLLAAVHDLVLGDPTCDLARHYPSVDGEAARERNRRVDPWPVFRAFALDRRAEVEAIVSTRHTQTNEVGRCAAVVPALELVHRSTGEPQRLLEVGASAGLNLCFDRFHVDYVGMDRGEVLAGAGDPGSSVRIATRVFDGVVPPAGELPRVARRVGLDLHPVDVADPAAVRWLEACIFPDRTDRLARLRAAVAIARADPPRVERGDAVADLARVAATIPGSGPLVVLHSWALTYVDDKAGFAAAVGALAADQDVWWLSVEPSTAVPGLDVPPRDARYTPEMAANTVTALMHVTPGGRVDRVLARSHPHLDWIHWLA